MAPFKCCVIGCDSTSTTQRLFCMPKDDTLRNLWMSFLVPVNPYLLGLTKDQLVSKRVCRKHFDDTQFDSAGVRIRYSYPCLFTEKEIFHGVPLSSEEYNVLNEHNYCSNEDQEDNSVPEELTVLMDRPGGVHLQEHLYILPITNQPAISTRPKDMDEQQQFVEPTIEASTAVSSEPGTEVVSDLSKSAMAEEKRLLSPDIDKLLQNCLVKLEQLDLFTCEICNTVYCDKDSLTRHLATHVKCEDTEIYEEYTSRYDRRRNSDTCKTSHKMSGNRDNNSETLQRKSIRDRIIFESESDDDDIFPKTEVSDDDSFVSEGDTSSTNDMLEETVSTSSKEVAEDSQNTTSAISNKENESKHILNMSYGKLILCNICKKTFTHESSLKIHELTHQDKNNRNKRNTAAYQDMQTQEVNCQDEQISEVDCQDEQIQEVDRHNKQTQKMEVHVCDLCHKEFLKKRYLVQHRLTHHLQKSWKCKFCGNTFKSKQQMQRHQRIHTDDKPYSCNICNKFFRNYSSYSFHTRNYHTKETPICAICDRRFSGKPGLLRHIQSVHMTTGYPCSVCKKEFGHPMVRASHMILHKETFKCSCGKSFKIKSDVIRHEALHKKAFECHHCNMRFGKKFHVDRHIKNSCKKVPQLQKKLFECETCHIKMQRKDSLTVHAKICKLRPYSCSKCRMRFVNKSSLNKHYNRCHRLKDNINK